MVRRRIEFLRGLYLMRATLEDRNGRGRERLILRSDLDTMKERMRIGGIRVRVRDVSWANLEKPIHALGDVIYVRSRKTLGLETMRVSSIVALIRCMFIMVRPTDTIVRDARLLACRRERITARPSRVRVRTCTRMGTRITARRFCVRRARRC